MQVHVLTVQGLVQCLLFRMPGSTLLSIESAAVKEVGSVVTWGTIQKTSELLVIAAIQKNLMGEWLRRHVG